ncbi:MAG TPA: HEAT repeat domain-containing protein [Anaeromyxobacteraceae bacterium]|nr:HEAT repeat domain-containing protein [Anaeromyxobacteraceae bacterium]
MIALAFFLARPDAAFADSLSAYSWATSQADGVSRVAWSAEQVSAFLESIMHPDDAISVGDFRFADLLGDGHLELVATIDYSGRTFFNHVLVVRRNGPAMFAVQQIKAFDVRSLDGRIVDVDGDGRQELVLPEALTPYLSGPVPQVRWVAIYRWTGTVYEDSSRSFTAYYSTSILPALRAALDHAKQSGDTQLLALTQLELDKAVRMSGASTEYGIDTARSLASSDDPNLRIWAACAFADIGTSATIEPLARLTADADRSVAAYAAAARNEAAAARCSRANISVISGGPLHVVNLRSKRPIRVAISSEPWRKGGSLRDTVTFGSSGFEQSLISCNDDWKERRCHFRISDTDLQESDGVVTLRAKLNDGSCVVGHDSVQVVDVPPGDDADEDVEAGRRSPRE